MQHTSSSGKNFLAMKEHGPSESKSPKLNQPSKKIDPIQQQIAAQKDHTKM